MRHSSSGWVFSLHYITSIYSVVHKHNLLYITSMIFPITFNSSVSQNVNHSAASPGVDGVTVAGQRLGGGSGVHVAGIGPSGRGRFRGVMLLHGRHGGPRAGALGSSCGPFLLIGTGGHRDTGEFTRSCLLCRETTNRFCIRAQN